LQNVPSSPRSSNRGHDARLPCFTQQGWSPDAYIPLSFLSGSKLPEVRRRHAFGLCKSTACALIDQTVVFWHR
jgi:hypothetical protein